MSDYDDFISKEREFVKILDSDQMKLFDDNLMILRALSSQHMTIKEIHQLFYNLENNEYSITIKTVYRRMEKLEDHGIVMVSGHRKPKNVRMTEKLYCRSATIFYERDKQTVEKWWEMGEGKRQLERMSRVMINYFNINPDYLEEVTDIIVEFYSVQDRTISNVLRKGSEDRKLANILKDTDINEIKSMFSLVSTIELIINNNEMMRKLNSIMNK